MAMDFELIVAYVLAASLSVAALYCLASVFYNVRTLRQQSRIYSFLHGLDSLKEKSKLSDRKQRRSDKRLAQAGVSCSSRTWFSFVCAITILAALGGALFGSAVLACFAASMVIIGSEAYLSIQTKRRRKLFDNQLARVLPQIAENLRAGISIEHATRAVTDMAPEPLADELRQVNAETSFSSDFSAALTRLAQRSGSRDVALLATATRISRSQGGSIASTIDTIAQTVDTRQEMRRYCESATSSTKLSAWIMVGMIIAIFIALSFLQEGFLTFYLEQSTGWICAVCSLALVVCGVFSIYRIADVSLD